jgi:hypothetical protein
MKFSLRTFVYVSATLVCSASFAQWNESRFPPHHHHVFNEARQPLVQHWQGKHPWHPGKGGGFGTDGNTLWYGGDFDGRAALSDERNNYRGSSAVYDNFTVTGGGWQVTDLFANLLFNYGTSGADFEIRSGVSAGNGGTVHFSGLGQAATQIATGREWNGWTEYTVKISNLNVTLAPGEYWLVVRSVTFSCGSGHLLSRAGSTTGANSIGGPIGDGNSFFTGPGANFVTTNQFLGAGTWDFSFGVNGTVVPEPSTFVLIGVGLAALAFRRRR